MSNKISIILYSDRQVLVELFLGKDESTFFPVIADAKLDTALKPTLSRRELGRVRAKVRDKYQVAIDNAELIPLCNSYLIVGEWEGEIPDTTNSGNRLIWVNLDEVPDILTNSDDIEAIKQFRKTYCEIIDMEHSTTLGIATKEQTQKYKLYHRPL